MKSNNIENIFFQAFTDELLVNHLTKRNGETKLGEKVKTYDNFKDARYVIIGINEDIGPQANLGLPGAKNGFNSFIKRFLNTQSNRFLLGDDICVYGTINTTFTFQNIEEARKNINQLDEFIAKEIGPLINEGKIIIVIGGGHNNAYPLIKSSYQKLKQKIDVINLDPHADCRPLEGRHSGNPFSYANEDGFMDNYTVFGLHQQYNSEGIYEYLDENNFSYTFFEDYILNQTELLKDLNVTLKKRDNSKHIGFEIDLDSIAFMPSSAYTPSGLSIETVRLYSKQIGKEKNISYLHLPEAAPDNSQEEKLTGKALTYIVLDFIKANKNK